MTDAELWEQHFAERTLESRNRLLVRYYPLVQEVAATVARRVPGELSDGTFGLIEAIEKFDPARGEFRAFARRKIRYAMFDGMSVDQWMPRRIRLVARRHATAAAALEVRLGRSPTARELAAELDVSVDYLERIRSEAAAEYVMSLERPVLFGADVMGVLADFVGGHEDVVDPDLANFTERLAAAIADLPTEQRLVLFLLYRHRPAERSDRETVPLKEVADVVGVSTSQASQLRDAAIRSLQRALGR